MQYDYKKEYPVYEVRSVGMIIFAVLFWPYSIIGNAASLVFLVGVLVVCFFKYTTKYGFTYSSPMLLFAGVVLAYFSISMISGFDVVFILAQSNHFFQFIAFYLLFINLFRLFDLGRLANKSNLMSLGFFVFLIFLVKIFIFGYDDYSGVDLNYFSFLVLSFMYVESKRVKQKLVICVFVLVFTLCLSSRASFLLYPVFFVFFVFFRFSRSMLLVLGLSLLLLPLLLAASIDYGELEFFYTLDHNTAIRFEFIRSALELLEGNLFLGNGFGTAFRSLDFDYISDHGLLTDFSSVHLISNHHSVLDTCLRMGVPATILFLYSIFIFESNRRSSNIECFLVVCIAVGLSVDAWFENQLQLPMFAFLSALLLHLRRKNVL